eukprot:COSAG01_NODE_48_length_31904_cov_21.696997_30_plen_82_part_00
MVSDRIAYGFLSHSSASSQQPAAPSCWLAGCMLQCWLAGGWLHEAAARRGRPAEDTRAQPSPYTVAAAGVDLMHGGGSGMS